MDIWALFMEQKQEKQLVELLEQMRVLSVARISGESSSDDYYAVTMLSGDDIAFRKFYPNLVTEGK